MYKAIDVAQYVRKHCAETDCGINNLKLQKILYFIQAEFLVTRGAPCFVEAIEAADFGPWIPEVYSRFRMYGSCNIPYMKEQKVYISKEDAELIDEIVDSVKAYSSSQLKEITRHQGPWLLARARTGNHEILREDIKAFFEEEGKESYEVEERGTR